MNKNLIKKLVENGTADMFGAFAETVKNEIASDDAKYENIGWHLLKTLLDNNVDDVLLSISGWYSETLLAKARIIPDVKKLFYSEPLDAYVIAVDIDGNEWFTPCKINMQSFEVYGCDYEMGDDEGDSEIVEEYITFDDMEDYRFPLKPKDEVFGPDCYDEDAKLDYSDVISYWYGENE